nr:myeloid protein 1-like [Pelodiscus sinensis]|eukprot:XP_025037023.1 myeloid protein 1-like [Pelodiscus sinensis]
MRKRVSSYKEFMIQVKHGTPFTALARKLVVAAGPWERICAGNPNNALRGCDKLGCGHYNASRDRHVRHKGVDVVCSDGSTVYAPFSVMIDRRVNPFSPGKNKPINNGIQLRGSGFCIQMLFFRPVKYRGRIFKRQKIGVLLPMQSVYPGITSLVHVQNCDRSDPTYQLQPTSKEIKKKDHTAKEWSMFLSYSHNYIDLKNNLLHAPSKQECNYIDLKNNFFHAPSKQEFAAGPWGMICAGNPKNKPRRCDRLGCGHYGAPRLGGRKHRGVDVICRDGSTVYAPFSGTIGGQVKPYRKNNAINNGLLLRGSGFCIHIFYIRPVKYRGRIRKGQKIGVMLPMQRVYRGITSHVHVQNCNLSDPTRNL